MNHDINLQGQHNKRYARTLDFLQIHLAAGSRILDLGTPNPLSERMAQAGYTVSSTAGENLDIDYAPYTDCAVDAVTAFEIFEHLFAPFNILRHLKTEKLFASVPLQLWFTPAYWDEHNDWDKHYHEFEIRQFNLLLDKTGWQIKACDQWAAADWKKWGLRPLLRHFFHRYYMVYCERK